MKKLINLVIQLKNQLNSRVALTTLVLTLGVLITSCGGSGKAELLEGAGASFPYPVYAQLFDEYSKSKGIKVNYQSIGSGGGIKQITEKTVDFGATDAYVSDDKLAGINDKNNNKLLHIPTVLGGVSITYNLPSVTGLRLDGSIIADIFMGKIKKWDDARINALNPDISLPNIDIIVIRRSDGSGTTSTFSSFLARESYTWKNEMGIGKSLSWFNGSIGAKGNEGVTGQLSSTPGSISYVSLNYAIKNDLPVVAIKNPSGNFVKPSVESVSLAADTTIADDTRTELTELDGSPGSYPISTFTWLVFYQEQNYDGRSREQAVELKKLLIWILSDEAQSQAEPLLYAPLPPAAIGKALAVINSMVYDGTSL